jgi:hypothetical protein
MLDTRHEIVYGKVCPYCGQNSEFVDSETIYGKSYGMIYLCRDCDAYVGVHKGKNRSLGRLANKELREAKKRAHLYFDHIWKRKIQMGIADEPSRKHGRNYAKWRDQCRKSAYTWLSEQLNIEKQYTHIGMFDIEHCEKVVELCKPFYKPNYNYDYRYY